MFRFRLGLWLYGILKITLIASEVTAAEKSLLARITNGLDGKTIGVGKVFCTFEGGA